MKYTELIAFEHTILLKNFEHLLKKAIVNHNYRDLTEYCQLYIEDIHHKKEEEAIFSAVVDKVELRSGGPFCVYYFDFYIQNSATQKAVTALKKENIHADFKVSPQNQAMYAKNTPLNVPIEEHDSGRLIINHIQQLLQSNHQDVESLNNLFSTYKEILSHHFEKEEKCFLPMTTYILTENEKEKINENLKYNYKSVISLYE